MQRATIYFFAIISLLVIYNVAKCHNNVNSKTNLNETINQQIDSANYFFSINLNIAEQYAQKAVLNSLNSDDYQLIIKAYQLNAKILKYSCKNSQALENAYNAIFYAIISRNIPKIIDLTIDIAEIMRSIGNLNIALDYLYSLEDILSSNDKISLSRIYNRIAAIYFEMNQYEYAIKFAQKSNFLIDKKVNPLLFADNKIIKGASLTRTFKSNEALEELLSAKKTYEKYSPIDLPYVLFNLCQAYSFMGDYKNAIKYGELSFEIAKKYNIEVYMQNAALYLIRSYLRARDVDNSLKYLKISDSLSQKLNIINQINKITEEENRIKLKLKEIKINEYKHSIDRNNKIISLSRWIVIIFAFTIIITFIYLQNTIKRTKQLRKLNDEIFENQKELIKYSNELNEANTAKNTFFSIISHDLRSPFHSILGLSDILITDFDQLSDAEKKNLVKMLNDSANNVYKLLDNLLKWAQTQTDTIKCEPENFNLYQLVKEIIILTKNIALNKNITVDLSGQSDAIVFADRNTIETVIRNLLSNALKFSYVDSKILINIEKNKEHVDISIKDFGIGMSESELSNLFSINKKNVKHGTNGEKGTGLGLVLSKEFVEKNGGRICIESVENEGTTVLIQLKAGK